MSSNLQREDSGSVASSVSDWTAIPSVGKEPSSTSESVASCSYQSSWRGTDGFRAFVPSSDVSSASSVISGFDMLDLNGESVRKCHACRFNNKPDAGICQGCGRALVANPNIFMDQELQASLMQKEERALLYDLRKRQMMHESSIKDQSDIGAKDVHQSVRYTTGFMPVPKINLRMAMDRFLHFANHQKDEESKVRLGFVFTTKKPGQIKRVQMAGFETGKQGLPVFHSSDEAYGYWVDYQSGGKQGHQLYAITEDDANSFMADPMHCVGWIVALFPGKKHTFNPVQTYRDGHVLECVPSLHCPGQVYNSCTLYHGDACIPLVCFDAELRKERDFVITLRSLQQTFLDFMEDIHISAESIESYAQSRNDETNKSTGSSTAKSDPSIKESPSKTNRDGNESTDAGAPLELYSLSATEGRGVYVGEHKMRFCSVCDMLVGHLEPCPNGCDDKNTDIGDGTKKNESPLKRTDYSTVWPSAGAPSSSSDSLPDDTKKQSSDVLVRCFLENDDLQPLSECHTHDHDWSLVDGNEQTVLCVEDTNQTPTKRRRTYSANSVFHPSSSQTDNK